MRKQYLKREPQASPLGPEPSRTPVPEPSPAPETTDDARVDETAEDHTPIVSTTHPTPAPEDVKEEDPDENVEGSNSNTSDSVTNNISLPVNAKSQKESLERDSQPQGESQDWLDLPMLTKLDSIHLLTEWQFQNPQRFRTIMKDDDEVALWVCARISLPQSWEIIFVFTL